MEAYKGGWQKRRNSQRGSVWTIDGSVSSRVSKSASYRQESWVSVGNNVQDANIKDKIVSYDLKVINTTAHFRKNKLVAFQLVKTVNDRESIGSSEYEDKYGTITVSERSRKNKRVKSEVNNFAFKKDNFEL